MKLLKLNTFIVIFLIGCKPDPAPSPEKKFSLSDTMLKRLEVTKSVMQLVKNELRLFGKVEADNNKMAHVYPVTGGIVSKVNVELGDYVKEGQLLATVRSSEVADFERQLLHARSDLAIADKNLQVARDLFAGRLTSEKEVLAAEKDVDKAKAELNRINEVYSIYHLNQGSEFRITAPISGFIIRKDITQNEELRSDRSEEVFTVAQINEVWVLANVNESNIAKVQIGYEAEVQTLSYPDRVFKGKVDKIFNVIDPATKAMKILVKINNSDLLLKPEMNATVNLKFSENKELVAVPSSAIIFDKNKDWVVIYKEEATPEVRQVSVYHNLGDIAYISSGISENESVISRNALLVYDALID